MSAAAAFGRIARVARRVAEQTSCGWPRAQYQKDIVGFARDILGITPWKRQEEILEAIRKNRRVAVCSGHRTGKSTSAAIIALWFYASFPGARVIFTAPTSRQCDEILYREIKRLHAEASRRGTPLDGDVAIKARSGIRASDQRQIIGITARDQEAFAGLAAPHLLFVLDEASGIATEIHEVLQGNMAGGASMLMLSNPTRCEGEFFEAFESKQAFYKTIQISSEESPNVVSGEDTIPGLATREWIEEKKEEWGEDSPLYAIRVRGQFVRHEAGRIMSVALLDEASLRTNAPDAGVLQIGVDPAGPGLAGDETAFCARRGRRVVGLQTHQAATEDSIMVHLLDFVSLHRRARETPLVCVDREGQIGYSLWVRLQEYARTHPTELRVVGIRASDKAPRQPHIYGTLRDELWANGSKWLQEGGSLNGIDDDRLHGDLHAASWVPIAAYGSNADKLKATDKRDLRKALGRSTDRGDAFLLSVWEPSPLLMQTQYGTMPVADTSSPDRRWARSEGSRDPGRVFDVYGSGSRRR